jgi:hypothetical protein
VRPCVLVPSWHPLGTLLAEYISFVGEKEKERPHPLLKAVPSFPTRIASLSPHSAPASAALSPGFFPS